MNLQPFTYNYCSLLDKKEGKTTNLKFRTRSTRTFRGTKIKAGPSSGRRLSHRMFISRFPPDVHKWHSTVFNNPSVPIGNWSSPFRSFISPHTFPILLLSSSSSAVLPCYRRSRVRIMKSGAWLRFQRSIAGTPRLSLQSRKQGWK